ncbi:MAG: ribonuclease III [Flavobacteriales bacterium]|jgi:ribonuclease III|nr:ribonuclease III [Flavobacteriales bacterium]
MRLFSKIFSKSRSDDDGIFLQTIQKITGVSPVNAKYYRKAFIHRSINKMDEKGNPINYERLEFLGDAMLSAVIAAHLFQKVPKGDEGYLTKMRSKIVSREHLNELGKDLNLLPLVQSKVPTQHFGENIYGNIFEALVGAIFLDKGFDVCQDFIHRKVIVPYVDIAKLEGKVISYKGMLIEWCQKHKYPFNFEFFEETTNESQKHFAVKLYINSELIAKARATSKKKAEETAAKRAYYAFQEKMERK